MIRAAAPGRKQPMAFMGVYASGPGEYSQGRWGAV